jgi:hypothetical protein
MVGGGYLYMGWDKQIIQWDLEKALRENEDLQNAISNLTDDQAVAYVDVIRRVDNQKGGIHVELIFTETEQGNPEKILRSEKVMAYGDETYFDASVVVFNDELLKKGYKSLYLWKRIFGSSQPPEQGHPLSSPDDSPMDYKSYEAITKACDLWIGDWFRLTKNAELFWTEVWNATDDPDSMISARQGDAVRMRLEAGKKYKLTIKNTGQILIQPDGESTLGENQKNNRPEQAVN